MQNLKVKLLSIILLLVLLSNPTSVFAQDIRDYSRFKIAQKELESSINDWFREIEKLEGKTIVRKSDRYVRKITHADILLAKAALVHLKMGDVTAKEFEEYEQKLGNYENVDQRLLSKAKETQRLAIKRDELAKKARVSYPYSKER